MSIVKPMEKSTVYAMPWVMPKLMLGPMPYLKIGVNSIADITMAYPLA